MPPGPEPEPLTTQYQDGRWYRERCTKALLLQSPWYRGFGEDTLTLYQLSFPISTACTSIVQGYATPTRRTNIPLIICRVIMISCFHFHCPSSDWSIHSAFMYNPRAFDATERLLM